jgi:mannose-6-phosphate isomerase
MNPPLPDILPLTPYLREIVWGGRRLQRFGKDLPPDVPIGEAFEVSALPGQECTAASGPLSGLGLREILHRYGQELVGAAVQARYGDNFPLLIKLIDAQDDLSIQVHPNDAYARAEGLGTFGKTEAWYVLHSDGARLALGLQDGTDEAALRRALTEARVEQAVLYQDVAVDDVILLQAGTVHALCRGVMVYEVQQSSDLTFRLYDYGRKGLDGEPRELHIDRGLAVTAFSAEQPHPVPAPVPGPGGTLLVDAAEFSLTLHGADTTTLVTADAFAAVTIISGEGSFADVNLTLAQTALVPAERTLAVTSATADLRYLVAAPGLAGTPC